MASSKEYLQFILEQLSDLEEINYRAMMGEYIIYYRGRIVGGSNGESAHLGLLLYEFIRYNQSKIHPCITVLSF